MPEGAVYLDDEARPVDSQSSTLTKLI